ncbi:MAG: ankyrin repeat domain-containing protein, partial [Acidobacteriota bacterium]
RQEEEKRRREDEERERRRAERRARIVAARASSKPSIPPRPVRPTAEPSRLPDFDQLRSPADATAAFEALFKQVDAAPVPVDPMAYEGIERFAILLRTAPVRSKRMVDFGEITGEELTEKGETPLMLAAMAGEAAVVRTLLDRGVEVDQADTSENQETALLKAAQSPSRGRQETIDALLDAGADLERRHGPAGRTPLMFAAQADVYNPDPHARIFGDTTRHLVKRGARLAAEDAAGDTLLKSIKRAALGAPTTSPFRRRLFDMLKVIEGLSGFTGDS